MSYVWHKEVIKFECKVEDEMIDKILKTFFVKKNKVKCLTIIKKREISCEINSRFNQKEVSEEKTCLSSYFEHRKGLNTLARQKLSV